MGGASSDAPGEPASGTATGTITGGRAFVGRQRELEEIRRGLDDAAAGRGRLFLLVGEPGIGKSRLADEAATAAAGRGAAVLWGRCWEAGGAPAYWPWLEVLEAIARSLDDAALRETLGDGAPLVAEILPALRARLDGAGAASGGPPPEASAARFRLWRALAALVRRGAADSPGGLALVLEDLHAADESSLLLLHFLARELRSMRALVLGTYRDVEARLAPGAGDLLARIGREGATLALGRLDRAATVAFLRQRAGVALPARVEARIVDSTQGNPLFVEEMARLLGAGDDAAADAIEHGALPDGVRDVIRQRLDRVPEGARPLLELAAVAGDELDGALLAAAAGGEQGAVAAELGEAVRAGVLVDRGGRRRFSHALVREVLYRDLAPDRRRALHGQVAAALERLHATAPSPPLAELAHHSLEGPRAGLERAADFSVRAAERALTALAYEEAVAVLERAVAAVAAAGNPARPRARVLLALAEARIRRGESDAGKLACREVATLARALGDGALLAQAALTYGQVFIFAVVDPVLVDLLEEALAAVPAEDSGLRVQLLARLGAALQPSVNTEEPVRVARQAIAMARRLGDPRTLLNGIFAGMSAMMDIVDPRERLALNLEAEQLASVLGDRVRLVRIHSRLVVDHMELGELAEADARIEAFEALARELRADWFLWRVPLFRAMRALLHGRFTEAEALAAEALALGRRAQDPQVERCLVFHRESFLREAARHEEMVAFDPVARQARAGINYSPAWQAMGSSFVFARLEDRERARLHLDLVPPELSPPVDNVFAAYHMVEAAALAGPPELVEKLHRMYAPAADRDAMLGMTTVFWGGPVARLVALLEARLGRWAEAEAHFELAIARARRLDAGPVRARTEYEYARALLEKPGAAMDKVRALLESSLATATALGMAGLVRQAEARLAGLTATAPQIAPAPAPAAPIAGDGFSMTSEGEYWTVSHDGRTFRLKDSLGLRYLARLVEEAGRELHVLDLAGGRTASGEDAGEAVDAGDAGELLDEQARERYRHRLDDLRDALAEAQSFGDQARAAHVQEEIDFLAAELGRAVGLGGRVRRAGGAAERARSAVQRRIRNAVDRIREHAPALADHLSRAVKTGNFCVYRR